MDEVLEAKRPSPLLKVSLLCRRTPNPPSPDVSMTHLGEGPQGRMGNNHEVIRDDPVEGDPPYLTEVVTNTWGLQKHQSRHKPKYHSNKT